MKLIFLSIVPIQSFEIERKGRVFDCGLGHYKSAGDQSFYLACGLVINLIWVCLVDSSSLGYNVGLDTFSFCSYEY